MVVVVHHRRCLLHLLQYGKVPLHPQGDLRLLRLWPVGLNLGHLGLSTQSTLWVLGRIIHSWIDRCLAWEIIFKDRSSLGELPSLLILLPWRGHLK